MSQYGEDHAEYLFLSQEYMFVCGKKKLNQINNEPIK